MPIIDPVTPQPHLRAFAGFGIELEYMIVDCITLAARPVADRVLSDGSGQVVNEIESGALAWSNELVLHVIEFKTFGPAASLDGLDQEFQRAVEEVNRKLSPFGAMLMPTAMHPLFNPEVDTHLWPHGQNEIYAAYDRIFGCRGHGWSNLQSMHINFPFHDDAEFRRLHAAIRATLPLIPALAASSPLEEGRVTDWLDRRLYYYRENQKRIPEISGKVVPEPVAGITDYQRQILEPMYRAIGPHDPEEVLVDDWLNSRGAIARFERQSIEIRIIDIQECPRSDLAIAEAVIGLVQTLYDGDEEHFAAQQALDTASLATILFETARAGSRAIIQDRDYLALFGLTEPVAAGAIWRHLLDANWLGAGIYRTTFAQLLERGTLAEAVIQRLGRKPTRHAVTDCYRELATCLAGNRLFQP